MVVSPGTRTEKLGCAHTLHAVDLPKTCMRETEAEEYVLAVMGLGSYFTRGRGRGMHAHRTVVSIQVGKEVKLIWRCLVYLPKFPCESQSPPEPLLIA